jgi:hypothetical protein
VIDGISQKNRDLNCMTAKAHKLEYLSNSEGYSYCCKSLSLPPSLLTHLTHHLVTPLNAFKYYFSPATVKYTLQKMEFLVQHELNHPRPVTKHCSM